MLRQFAMASLRIVMLLVALVVCYLLFSHLQTPSALPRSAVSPAPVSSEYKQAMDKAHAAARQMQEQRTEADAIGKP